MPDQLPDLAHGVPRDRLLRIARQLIAVPWRQAAVIAACAIAGGAASLLVSLRQPPAPASAAQVRVQAPPPAGPPASLRMDLEPEARVAPGAAAPRADAAESEASTVRLQLDDARPFVAVEAMLSLAPPAAGGPSPDRIGAWRGLVAGLLAGLLLAGLRELRGQRMRSPREAERALGVPVLGSLPTLSAKARAACFGPPDVPMERA